MKWIRNLSTLFALLIEYLFPIALQRFLRTLFLVSGTWHQGKIIRDCQAQLDEILIEPQKTPAVIFVPGLDWNAELYQRPHQLAVALSRLGQLVFYLHEFDKEEEPGFHLIDDHLYICNVPVKTFKKLKSAYVYVLTWNCKYLAHFEQPKILYDFVDEIDVFYGNKKLFQTDHEDLLQKSEVVLATSQVLYRKVFEIRQDVIYCPNAVDYAFFSKSRQLESNLPPSDLAGICNIGKPIIGYYGALARWFDYDLVRKLAEIRPDLSFVLIGPDYDGSLKKSGLMAADNIYWLGQKPYHNLPEYLSFFDVAMIPFVLNGITHATSPLKLFEYFAAGKPVIITPMQESMRYDNVLVAADADMFSKQIDAALGVKDNIAFLQEMDEIAQLNTWSARANQILEVISKCREEL